MKENKNINWQRYSITCAVLIVIIMLIALYTTLWVITAVPTGFLFGFFLKKGELCGSSAMSEVVLMRERSKAFGFWVAIVVSMAGFAVLELLGLVTLAPKPLQYLNLMIGGILFGSGIVLAGGCISGCLFKAAAGNINSMAGLVGIPLGISLVMYGPLRGFNELIRGFTLKSQKGGPVTLSSLTGLPFWLLACLFIIITVAVILFRKGKRVTKRSVQEEKGALKRVITKPWKPWQAGFAIGILAVFAYLSSAATGRNYPLGVTNGVLHLQQIITENNLNYVYRKPEPGNVSPAEITSAVNDTVQKAAANPERGKTVNVWLLLLVTSLMAGSWVSARLSGTMQFILRPPDQTLIAFSGGIILGAGAAIGGGCVIGNILSGWALMSVGMFLFGAFTIIANWAVTYFYLMGGSLGDLFEI